MAPESPNEEMLMKYRVERTDGEDEVIIRCREVTPKITRLLDLLEGDGGRLVGVTQSGAKSVIAVGDILYIESVDGRTYVYTEAEVVRVDFGLSQLNEYLDDIRFFRCSKSMILNIDKAKYLKSLASNRIDVTMVNGEHIRISRTYASDFRKRLRGE